MKKFTAITMEGDTLEIEIFSGFINMRLFDLNRSDATAFTAINLSTGASLELRDALVEHFDR